MWLRYLIAIGYALLLVGLTLHPIGLIENRVLGFYGTISYSLYLCHAPLVYAMSPVFRRVCDFAPTYAAYFICVGITFSVVTPLAYLSYLYIERPGIKLGHAVFSRISLSVGLIPNVKMTSPVAAPKSPPSLP